MKRYILWLLCCATILLYGCEQQTSHMPSTTTAGKAYAYAKSFLSEQEQVAYTQVLQTWQTMAERAVLADVAVDEISTVITAVLMDHPEIFYLADEYHYEILSADTSARIIYYPAYRFSLAEKEALQQKIQAACEPIVQTAKTLTDDVEKVRYVYDTIIEQTSYRESAKENQNILSTFLYKETVCAGYAKGIQYLLNQLGIPCTTLTGNSLQDGEQNAHAWNMVQINGAYYYLDATNGDQDFPAAELRYMYFAMSEKMLLSYCQPFTPAYIRASTSQEASYFVTSQAYFHEADENQLEQLINTYMPLHDDRLLYQCQDEQVAQALYEMLQTQQLLSAHGYTSFSYYAYPTMHTYFVAAK